MSLQNQIVMKSEGLGALRIGPRYGDYLDLEIEREGLRANTRIYLYDDNINLLRFIDNLSMKGKAWEGVKAWGSIEGDFKIASTMDSLGHISFDLEITNRNIDPYWMTKTTLIFDPGDFDHIVEQAKVLLS